MSKPIDDEVVQTFLSKYGSRPVSWKIFMENMATLSDTFASKTYAPLAVRIAALEKELTEVKAAKPNFADVYGGVWQPGLHERGAAVTWEGSLWLCRADTVAKPGTNGDWQLLVKRGRDGKDLRA